MCTGEYRCAWRPEVSDPPGYKQLWVCGVGVKNQTHVLWKNSICSWLPSHLSSLLFCFVCLFVWKSGHGVWLNLGTKCGCVLSDLQISCIHIKSETTQIKKKQIYVCTSQSSNVHCLFSLDFFLWHMTQPFSSLLEISPFYQSKLFLYFVPLKFHEMEWYLQSI